MSDAYLDQMYGFNPTGAISSSRKSVYSNKELQKNNFFREDHENGQMLSNDIGKNEDQNFG